MSCEPLLMNDRTHSGYQMALVSSVLLLTDALVILVAMAVVFSTVGFQFHGLHQLLQNSALPLVLYAIWGLGIFGTVGAFAAILFFGFRARWFWRCLVITACLWLIFPPVHMILGLLALIILVRCREDFPLGKEPFTAAP